MCLLCFVVVDKVKDSDSRFAFLRRKCFLLFVVSDLWINFRRSFYLSMLRLKIDVIFTIFCFCQIICYLHGYNVLIFSINVLLLFIYCISIV